MGKLGLALLFLESKDTTRLKSWMRRKKQKEAQETCQQE